MPTSFVLIHTVTLFKDFYKSGLINFSAHQISLCLPPPPLSSGFVDRTDDSMDFGTSVSEPRDEESNEGRGRK
ncbi:hypothetical protein PBY51_020652 [Eleginops maclovinus]|uniref:Uncharacterized protein n=1 Tax=Eleginops maclovinus TaxID=56733 RepID=A0AAN7XMW7_ELEMC|nr:hypothetical protein PBY51_020652 [Eleginops maclovinus]